MNITKLGHCCLLIEEKNLKILTDPGAWTTAQNEVRGIGLILITHEHPDHLHLESLKTVLQNNPQAKIMTNGAVGKLLADGNIDYTLLEHGSAKMVSGVNLEGYGDKHAVIYQGFGLVQNTGYLIGDRLFYPGDALYNPGKPVDILALPVAGPWLKISEAVDYAKAVKPKIAFPVHDALINSQIFTGHHAIPGKFLPPVGIEFQALELLKEYEF